MTWSSPYVPPSFVGLVVEFRMRCVDGVAFVLQSGGVKLSSNGPGEAVALLHELIRSRYLALSCFSGSVNTFHNLLSTFVCHRKGRCRRRRDVGDCRLLWTHWLCNDWLTADEEAPPGYAYRQFSFAEVMFTPTPGAPQPRVCMDTGAYTSMASKAWFTRNHNGIEVRRTPTTLTLMCIAGSTKNRAYVVFPLGFPTEDKDGNIHR